jgi:hypothetical protein
MVLYSQTYTRFESYKKFNFNCFSLFTFKLSLKFSDYQPAKVKNERRRIRRKIRVIQWLWSIQKEETNIPRRGKKWKREGKQELGAVRKETETSEY